MNIIASEIDKMFLLKSIKPFDTLDERTLFNIAEVTRLSYFDPDTHILNGKEIASEVVIEVEGELTDSSGNRLKIVGLHSILSDSPLETDIYAGSKGCRCLRIGKGHFLTTIYECPGILTELMQLRNLDPHYYV